MTTKVEIEAALHTIESRLKEPEVQARLKGVKQDLTLTFTDLNLSYLVRVQEAIVEPTIVQPGEKHRVELVTDGETFLGILNRRVDALSAFTGGRLKVHGSLSDLLKLQSLLRSFS